LLITDAPRRAYSCDQYGGNAARNRFVSNSV